MQTILTTQDGPAFEVINPDAQGQVVLVCEHASQRVPQELGNLGLTGAQFSSHIAWDLGAKTLARNLSAQMDATLIEARFSRLIYDCNRPADAITAMPFETEVCTVPGNKAITASDRLARTLDIYVPFHAQVSKTIAAKRAGRIAPVLVTVHSFTPAFNGLTRDVEIGLLHSQDDRLAAALREDLRLNSSFDVRLNEPYAATDGVLHTIDKHLDDADMPHVMLEVRNDLLADHEGGLQIASLLAQRLAHVISRLSPMNNLT